MAKSSDLLFRILGKDVSGSKALKGVGATAGGVGKSIGRVGTAFAGIGTAAAVAGGIVAIDFGKQSVAAFMEAQDSQAKFEGSLKKNGLGSYTKKIDELSQALALKTKFDDDATKSGAAVLANFGLTGAELTKVIPLAQDYAAFTGKDMPTASKLLGKAFLGNVKALKDLGIAYKPTGDKAKDMAAIMDLVNEKVGGFAEKQGKTAAGTAAILSNQFGEVKEQIGSYLVPALTRLGRWIIDNGIPAIQQFAAWFKVNLLPVIQSVAAWVTGTFIPAVKSLAASFMTNVWPAIKQVAGMLAQNLKPAIASVAALWTNTLQPAFVKAWPTIQKVIGVVALLVAGMLVFTSKVIGVVVPAIAAFIGKVVEITGKMQEVVVGIGVRVGKIVAFFKELPTKIKSAVSNFGLLLVSAGRDLINGLVNGIKAKIGDATGAITGLGSSLVDKLKGVLGIASPSKVFRALGMNVTEGMVAGIRAGKKDVIATVSDMAKAVIEKSKAALDALKQQRADMASSLASGLRGGTSFSSLLSANGDAPITGKGLVGGFRGFAAKMKAFASTIVKLKGLGLNPAMLQQIVGLGPDQGMEVANALLASGKGAVMDLNSSQSQIDAAAGYIGNTVGNATYGGQITAAQARYDRMTGTGSGPITVNVAGSVVGGTPEQIARALADYLKRAQGSGRVRTA